MKKKIKKSFKNNTFNISDATWNEVFELLDGLYSVSDIQEYFEYILKKRWGKINDNKNLSIKIYVNKIEKRITSKTKTRYYLELLTHEAMKLFESSRSKITKDENGENMPHLEITEVVLVHCNIVNSDYQLL